MKTLFRALMLVLLISPSGQALCAEKSTLPPLLERAKELLLSNRPYDALMALSSYSPSHAEMSAYHYAYARALIGMKKYHASLEHYRLAYVYAEEIADQERLLLERADVYAAMGYYPEAAVSYELFLRKHPKTGYTERAELGNADARFRSNEFRQALAHYEKAGTSARAVMGKANALQAVGRTTEARDLYQTLIEQESRLVNSSPETLYWIGENFLRSGKLKDGRVYFELVKDPVLKNKAALGLGKIAMEEKSYEAAIIQFAIAAESRDRAIRQEAMLCRADAQLRLGKNSEARSTLEELRINYPYGPQADQAVLLLAQLLRKEGKPTEAAVLMKTLIYRRNPVPAALDQLEAMVLDAKDRDPKEFVKLWSEAGHWLLDPARAGAITAIAKALRHEGKVFLDVCSWLIKSGPEDAKSEGRLLLARFYADLGDAGTAWSYLKRAKIKDRPDEIARLKATIYLADNDGLNASEALMSLREPGEADLLLLLQAMGLLKQSGKATAFCERILRKGPFSAVVLVRFADALYAAGNQKKALEYYHAALAARPAAAGPTADVEWAHYRIAAIVQGENGAESLRAVKTAKNVVGRFAAAELKGMELRGRVE